MFASVSRVARQNHKPHNKKVALVRVVQSILQIRMFVAHIETGIAVMLSLQGPCRNHMKLKPCGRYAIGCMSLRQNTIHAIHSASCIALQLSYASLVRSFNTLHVSMPTKFAHARPCILLWAAIKAQDTRLEINSIQKVNSCCTSFYWI